MDPADIEARQHLLADPLRAALEQRWPHTRFTLDLEQASDRPGEPIGIRWADGPTPAGVAAGLAPRWDVAAEPAGHAYPVRLDRCLSPTAQAVVLLQLHREGALGRVADGGRHALAAVVQQRLGAKELPGALDGDELAAAELLAEICGTKVGRDPFAWACWLSYGGGDAVLSAVLPGALEQPHHDPV